MKKNPKLCAEYDKIIKDHEAEGTIEEVVNEIGQAGGGHYTPHREVIRNERDTTKIRIVYGCDAKVKDGVSLNDCLEKGPCMLPLIFNILIGFRCYKYALTSDIKSAFLNIRVDEKDQHYLRFLWVDDVNKPNQKTVIYRFTSGLFGLAPSPFLLNATISTHMEKYLETHYETIIKFLNDLYMDDSTTGAQSEAYELYQKIKKLMLEGGFVLRKWNSNDDDLKNMISKSERDVYGLTDHVIKSENKVLGIKLSSSNDSLIFGVGGVVENAIDYEKTYA